MYFLSPSHSSTGQRVLLPFLQRDLEKVTSPKVKATVLSV